MHAWECQPLEAMQTWVWRALRMSLDSEEIGHMKEVGGGALVSSLFYSFFCLVCSSHTSFYAILLHQKMIHMHFSDVCDGQFLSYLLLMSCSFSQFFFVFDFFSGVDMQQIIGQHLLTLLRFIRSNLLEFMSIRSSAPPRSMSMAGSSTLCNVGVDQVKSLKAFIYGTCLEERAQL